MILFPAIDLKDGQCVRLEQGDMARATDVQRRSRRSGARPSRRRASSGCTSSTSTAPSRAARSTARRSRRSSRRPTLPVQLGGGIRDMAAIERWLDKGDRARHPRHGRGAATPTSCEAAASEFPGLIAVGIDARGGKVAVRGWAETTEMSAVDLARRFEDAGVAAIIYTDIERDGLLKGLNIAATLALANAVSIPVIASGGLASLADVERLLEPDCAILEGAIAGRALYDGRLDGRGAGADQGAEALALVP